MFKKVLIANRGAISCRIQRTLRKLGVAAVVVYTEADRESLHVLDADERVLLAGSTVGETYLNSEAVIEAALSTGAEAIHPGYGFLSENADFARACEEADIVFLGPTPDQLETCGLKHLCRDIARQNGVPLLEGSDLVATVDEAVEVAKGIGFPVIIKSSAGGGGIGMQVAQTMDEIAEKFAQVQRLAQSSFGDQSVFLEKYIERARHIEVQIFGDGEGQVLSLGERDCSAQRRHQKVVEETPAPGLTDEQRSTLAAAAVKIAGSVNYKSAGTIEFLWDDVAKEFFFLEVNARLQVEHGVTEEVWGVDLVEWMVRLGADEEFSSLGMNEVPNGHAIQVRLYAEDPNKECQPSVGLVTHFVAPEGARCDTWIQSGTQVSPYYDPMLAKIVIHRDTREQAIEAMQSALGEMSCYGVETNLEYLAGIIASDEFGQGIVHTRFLNTFDYQPCTIDVIDAGLETTIQDYPGRIGNWDVGVPPSGPIDALHFRLGNHILGNDPSASGLEISVKGGTLKFNTFTNICLTGADMGASLNGEEVLRNVVINVSAGDVLKMGFVKGSGQRAYLAISGGFKVPLYLGSQSTFRLGKFGGHGGRALLPGDVLHIEKSAVIEGRSFNPEIIPELSHVWDIRVVYGPHGAPEFFTDNDIKEFFLADWEVHYNSDRTGIRLIGPKPQWARRDGGEAGLHPSNIHDNAYTIGSVDFTGDMPILLGPDGPSLGGFVCPAVIAKADLWKMGQLKAGDKIHFHCVLNDHAESLYTEQEEALDSLNAKLCPPLVECREAIGDQVLDKYAGGVADRDAQEHEVTYRQSGDGVILVEFGEMELSLDLRFRAQALYDWLLKNPLTGILELVPGIRSLQVQYDPSQTSSSEVLDYIQDAEQHLPPVEDMEFESRIVHLPLSWDDPSTQLAIEKYMQIVRDDAPWCPSNIEFIRRINGLDSIEDVKRIVYDASYFVMGLGDVYLGAPVATPLDPRHRLVTTKYNPARTWTPENAVGIGGAYLCIYGMEGPGGYQFVGRTLPIWNRYHQTKHFQKPWLLRFFDQIRWFPVSESELLKVREQFLTGEYDIRVEPTTFRVRDYHQFLNENSDSIASFRKTQQAAFSDERADWERTGAMTFEEADIEVQPEDQQVIIPEDCEGVYSPIVGSMWKVEARPDQVVKEGDQLFIVESMKTEFSIGSTCSGIVVEVFAEPNDTVTAGQLLIIIKK